MRHALAFFVCGLLLLGCAAPRQLAPAGGFRLALGREHPLAGRIWSRKQRALTDPFELRAAVAASRVLLLGETHDNPDQHRLQAALLATWLDAHPTGSVGFEMIDEAQAPALTPAPATPEELATKLSWATSGWPEFALYRPLFEVALARKVRLFAAHPSRERVRAAMHGVTPDEARALVLDPPLPAPEQKAQAQEIRDSHCGQAPEAMVAPMVAAQTFKDAWMARAVTNAGAAACLVAGRGHVRDDRGVPTYLSRRGAKAILTVAFMDVSDKATKPEEYEIAPYDYVVFTPRTSDASACDRFREQLAKMRRGP